MILTQDYTNCRHEFRKGAGKTAAGSKREACSFCHKTFTIDPKVRTARLTDKEIRAVYVLSFEERRPQREVAAIVGIAKPTVQKYRQKIRAALACHSIN